MSDTADAASLLRVAIQDLCRGKRLLERRLPAVAGAAAAPALAELLAGEAVRAGAQAERWAAAGARADGEGPENLWVAGMLDDAERDARTTARGRWRDVALVGAARKMMAAQIVSNETAAALADRLELPALAEAARANRADEVAADRALAALLASLAA